MDKIAETFDINKKIMAVMIRYFGDDDKRIGHARKVTLYAEKILKTENGDPKVVIPAAILHDIGIKECEKKYNSAGGQLQEKEGPPIAKKILEEREIKQEIISEVCSIIACHHSPGEINTLNFNIIWDADWLVNLKEEYDLENKERLKKIIEKIFMTNTGKRLAKQIYLN